ncbi:hypothetical protein ACFL0F_00245 [Patescibacteria group bacterium]
MERKNDLQIVILKKASPAYAAREFATEVRGLFYVPYWSSQKIINKAIEYANKRKKEEGEENEDYWIEDKRYPANVFDIELKTSSDGF